MPAITPPDLNQAKENTDFIDRFATSSALTTPDRLGRSRITIEGVVAKLNDVAMASATAVNAVAAQAARVGAEAARDSLNTTGKVFTAAEGTAAGIAATASGQQFSVLAADLLSYGIWRNNAGVPLALEGMATQRATAAIASKVNGISSFSEVDRYTNSTVLPGYRNKDTGAYTPAPAWVTILLPYDSKHEYQYTATGNTGSVGLVIAYNAASARLGTIDQTASASGKILDHSLVPSGTTQLGFSALAANAHSVIERVYSVVSGALGSIPAQIDANTANMLLMLKTGAQVDWSQATSGTYAGFVTQGGAFSPSGSWKTTPPIDFSEAAEYLFTGFGQIDNVASVSMWDETGDVFMGTLYKTSVQVNNIKISSALAGWNPLCKKLRASGAISGSNVFAFKETRKNIDESLIPGLTSAKARLTALEAGAPTSVRKMVPTEVYGRVNETKYLYARQIVQDPSLDLAWNVPISNDLVAEIKPVSTADIPLVIQGMGRDGAGVTLASFNMKVSPEVLINPSSDRFVCMIGDSTNFSIIGATGTAPFQGAYPNELSRLLTGVGRPILVTGDSSPAPLAMTSLKFIGTLGNEIVKCEGRPGWSADDYLTKAVGPGGLTNAFWNSGASQFDMAYYCTQNGFTNVAADGSNLTIIFDLGWNEAYSKSGSASAAILATLVDRVRATHALADILIVGLNPPPKVIRKAFTDSRYVSPAQIFQKAIVEYGTAYRAMAATKTRCYFLQVSQEYEVERAYPKLSQQTSIRSAANFPMSTDYVHPGLEGYAMKADAVRSWMIYKYCRGV